MFDIVTFGSATKDIFIKSEKFKQKNDKEFIAGKALCVPLGSKVHIKARDVDFLVGGSGVNTSATFVRQGLKTAILGMVGDDASGQDVISEIKSIGADASFILKTKKSFTNQSVILSLGKKDRTILSCRGAGEELRKGDINWKKLKTTKWFYISSLSKKLSLALEDIMNFAKKNNIKVAFNPGSFELNLPKQKLKKILNLVDILLLNQEEASFLTKIPYKKEAEVFKSIDDFCPGVAIMTKGPLGVVASDDEYLYSAKTLPAKEVDRTGAGDSFGSGFVSGFIKTNGDVEYSIQLGVANSAACLGKIGATKGLLKKGKKWRKVKVKKTKLF